MYDVPEVARQLGLSERLVRRQLERGVLVGQRLARQWVVSPEELEAFRRRSRADGRPWSGAAAWALLGECAGLPVPASAVQRSRARQRLQERRLAELVPRLERRAECVPFYAHPAALKRLRDEPAVVLAGASAAPHLHADLIVADDGLDAYVRASDVQPLVDRFALDADARRANVTLRVVEPDLWPFPPDARVAPAVVVAVDLVESPDSRARRAGQELLEAV